MRTKTNTKGVRNHNTNVAPPQAESGVTVNPSAAVPPVVPNAATPGSTPELTVSALTLALAEIKSFREVFVPAFAKLHTALGVIHSGNTPQGRAVLAQRKEAAGMYADLLRQYPVLTTRVDPAMIDAGIAVDTALAMVKNDLQQAVPIVESGGRVSARVSWTDASVIRAAAKAEPNKPPTLVAAIASIETLLRQGKRVTATKVVAARAQTTATNAQQRAARAARTATQAGRVAARVTQAHADRHPLTPDVVIVPAGSTTPTDPNGTPPKG